MSVVHSYFGFSGRINRAKFWMLSILLFVFSIVAWIVACWPPSSFSARI